MQPQKERRTKNDDWRSKNDSILSSSQVLTPTNKSTADNNTFFFKMMSSNLQPKGSSGIHSFTHVKNKTKDVSAMYGRPWPFPAQAKDNYKRLLTSSLHI